VTGVVLAEHFFRQHYGRLVAVLTRQAGVRHIQFVEDAVQSALEAALSAWTSPPYPDNPGAWLYKVARNRLIQDLRRESGRMRILERVATEVADEADDSLDAPFPNEIRDDLLRMLFVSCDDVIPEESRIVLALRTLCGFNAAEIAVRLFTSEDNIHQRLSRARDRLRQQPLETDTPSVNQLSDRLPSAQGVLYLLFNEGYLSARPEHAIRRELCEEAIRLTTLLAEHPVGAVPETFALLALMHLHAARLGSRASATGGLLLLEEQDRSLWDRERIRSGMEWLTRSASGGVFSRFHAEAGIAAQHCLAASYQETRWDEIADLYATLERTVPSPLHRLNRAIAVAESQGPSAGLDLLEGLAPPPSLQSSHLWDAVLADLHRRAGHNDLAEQHRERALRRAPTHAVRQLLARRLEVI
jgi:RNA polymerase sigma factor (sigma-70 family)